jgi:hypothetical protein
VIAGLIGKPNTGKSTFFNAATLLSVPMANYPFTTVSPNFGIAYLRTPCVCRSLGVTDSPANSLCVDGVRLIPVRLVDVAGLVPGAAQGRGLGNRFLDDLRQADVLIHVVDASGGTDTEGRAVEAGSHNPLDDVAFVEREFDLWVAQILDKEWSRLARTAESGAGKLHELLQEKLSGLQIRQDHLLTAFEKSGLKVDKPTAWSRDDLLNFVSTLRQVAKPVAIAGNKADLPTAAANVERLRGAGYTVIPCAAEAELLLRRAAERNLIRYLPGDGDFAIPDASRLSPEQRRALELVATNVLRVWGSTGVQRCLNTAYFDLLGSVVVYPVEDETRFADKKGRVLPDAYVMPRGSTARSLAFALHSELGASFLHAVDARTGIRLGADYVLKDRDVVKIVAAARRG